MKTKKGSIRNTKRNENLTLKKELKNQSQTVFVTLTDEEFHIKLGEILQKGYTWDELNWLVGIDELKLSNAIDVTPMKFKDSFPQKISIDLTKIKKKSNNEEICNKVDELSEQGKTLDELRWELAYQEYIIDSINKIF